MTDGALSPGIHSKLLSIEHDTLSALRSGVRESQRALDHAKALLHQYGPSHKDELRVYVEKAEEFVRDSEKQLSDYVATLNDRHGGGA